MTKEEFKRQREIRRWKERRYDYYCSDTVRDYHEERKLGEERNGRND